MVGERLMRVTAIPGTKWASGGVKRNLGRQIELISQYSFG
jgi:hypothetical protein